jgi:hypothetical protein
VLLALLLAIAAALSSGCAHRQSRTDDRLALQLAVGMALTPNQDVVAWSVDPQGGGISTWVKGNEVENETVAHRPGIVIPVGVELWQWQRTAAEVPLCACEAWKANGRQGQCPTASESGVGQVVELVELVSGERLELVAAPTGTGDDGGPIYIDFSTEVEPIASVGPYLFYRSGQGGAVCGAAQDEWWSEFQVFDLERRQPVEIFGEQELARIRATEQQAAYQLMADDKLVQATSADDLELTMIEPSWSPAGLSLQYQFTADAAYVDSDDNRGSYSRSVSVPAGSIPESLALFAAIPAPLQSFAFPSGDQGRVGGFGVVLGTPEQIDALVAAFTGDSPSSAQPE